MPARTYDFPQPLRRLLVCRCLFRLSQRRLLLFQCHTDPKRKIRPFDSLNATPSIDLKRLTENLSRLRKFGTQFLSALSFAQKIIALIVVCVQPNLGEYVGKPAQERIAGHRTVKVMKSLHAIDLDEGYERTGLACVKRLPVRQSGDAEINTIGFTDSTICVAGCTVR